jgi:hypothetical protein
MAGKSKAVLEADIVELNAQIATLIAERDGARAERDGARAERDEFSARVVMLEANAANIKTTLDTISTGHFESDRAIKALEATQAEFKAFIGAELASLQALFRQRTWAEQASSGAPSGRLNAPAPPTPSPSAATALQPRTRGEMPLQNHPLRHQQPQPSVAIGKFVLHAPNSLTPDQAHDKVAHALGCNTAAIHSVRKLSPTRPAAPSAPAPAAAAPSTSAAGAMPLPAAPNAVFIFTTTSDLAVLAVKGGLRKILRAQETNMFIDDCLTREQLQERKRREPERKALKDAGVAVGWRGAQLWKVVKVGDSDAWRIVPAAPLLPAPPAAVAHVPHDASTLVPPVP